jgi:hypothetical protein
MSVPSGSTSRRLLGPAALLSALLLSSPAAGLAQRDSTLAAPDSARAFPRVPYLVGADSTAVTPARGSRSPWVAVGLSAALPGAGQVYTKNYWKVPVIWGLGGYWIYEWFRQNDKYKDFRARYSASITPSTPGGSSELLGIRDFYRDQRDSFAWYMGFLYFLNLVDAYVDGHLYDFDVSPDLTADGHLSPKLRATVHIPLY